MHTKLSETTELKNDLIGYLHSEVAKGGVEASPASIQLMGELTDMIKDLAEAEEKCWKACYYKEIVCAMDEARADEGGDRMGYDTRRYASGRYAPKGHGHYSPVHGYTPMWGPYMDQHMMSEHDGMMGYPMTKNQTGTSMTYGMTDGRSDYGRSYDGYRRARQGYHETHSQADKHVMDEHAKKHLTEAEHSIKEIWEDADPEMRRKMKSDLSKLVNDMNV